MPCLSEAEQDEANIAINLIGGSRRQVMAGVGQAADDESIEKLVSRVVSDSSFGCRCAFCGSAVLL